MLKFHTSRELAQTFGINLAKWKRWSREFLPPDPLGGLQSGYARQYNLDEAFTVYMGGHLVGELKFSIPEAQQILEDLRQWLVNHNFYLYRSESAPPAANKLPRVEDYRITIFSTDRSADNPAGLAYRVRAIHQVESIHYGGVQMSQERFIEVPIGRRESDSTELNVPSYRILNISALRHIFMAYLQLSPPKNP